MKIVNAQRRVTDVDAKLPDGLPVNAMTKRFIPVKPLSFMLFLLLEGSLISAGFLPEAHGARIDVLSDGNLSGNHILDSVYMSGGTLRVHSNTVLGHSGLYSFFEGGHLIVNEGVKMEGENLFHGDVAADIATGASERSQLGFSTLHQQATVHFGNVLLSGFKDDDHYGPTEALQLNDNGHAILSDQTRVVSVSPVSDAVNMFDNSTLSAEGSDIAGKRNGIRMTGNTTLNLKQVKVMGSTSGIVASDNAAVIINGGDVLSQGGNGHDDMPAAGLVAGRQGFIASPGGVTVSVTGANIRGEGGGSAGIASGSGNTGSTRISLNHSIVSGRQYGIRFFHVDGETKAHGQSYFSAGNTLITSSADTAIAVDNAARADIVLTDASAVVGGNGRALVAGQQSHVLFRIDNSTVSGDIINNGGTLSVNLKNHARWQGGMHRGNAVSLDPGTDWTLTSTSTVDEVNNRGHIFLSAAGPRRNTLTAGDYVGNGGEIHFNSVLGGDSSSSDKMVITGSSVGQSDVSVSNVGGGGDRTVNGIELIRITGSPQGNFTQKGRITAGLYDYTLNHNADRTSWFLTSRSTEAFVKAEAVYRPEAGSYIANLGAARTLFVHSRRDRGGETVFTDPVTGQTESSSFWLLQSVNHRRFTDQSGQINTKGNMYVVQAGGNLLQWDTDSLHSAMLGLMGGYGNSRSNSRSRSSDYSSQGSVSGYNVGFYGTWESNKDVKTGPYVDTWANYSWFDQHVEGQGIAAETGNLSGVTASAESGYTWRVGSPVQSALTDFYITPAAQLIWMNVEARESTEHNGTRVDDTGKSGYQTRLGMRVSMQGHQLPERQTRKIEPFVEANWIHNTTAPGITMDGEADRQAGAGNLGEGKVGIEGQLGESFRLWANVGLQAGEKGYRNSSAFTGLKYSF